eukprot:CAMPEP_0172721140 /NCGR_PEP_ID=MMETSP1074-20121228/78404_1 /TAXON_ID=2916 /ORGANISM="Ceratium fusus, Strain PA161109" /LENGTH=210 /DNA_ID=CAMNT_0013546809 /DNA_START=52 /DNA_END=684 /DNA_ORIENTATION=-
MTHQRRGFLIATIVALVLSLHFQEGACDRPSGNNKKFQRAKPVMAIDAHVARQTEGSGVCTVEGAGDVFGFIDAKKRAKTECKALCGKIAGKMTLVWGQRKNEEGWTLEALKCQAYAWQQTTEAHEHDCRVYFGTDGDTTVKLDNLQKFASDVSDRIDEQRLGVLTIQCQERTNGDLASCPDSWIQPQWDENNGFSTTNAASYKCNKPNE